MEREARNDFKPGKRLAELKYAQNRIGISPHSVRLLYGKNQRKANGLRMGQPSDSEADSVRMLQPSARADHAKQNIFREFCKQHGVRSVFKPGKRRSELKPVSVLYAERKGVYAGYRQKKRK